MDHVVSAIAGGALIGLAASLLLLAKGRIAGVSGMVAGLLPAERGEWADRVWFLAGLFASGLVARQLAPQLLGASPRGLIWLAVAGLLVGAGTRLSGGCTSGHGVCGISRFAPRSIVATLVFIACGVLTASVLGATS
jgi:uncharacterized membrane protein YedE/YeeE